MTDRSVSKWWFEHNELWFGCTPDEDLMIKDLFGHYLDNPSNLSKLDRILLYDQIVRHIHRGNETTIAYYHSMALEISLDMIGDNDDLNYHPDARCFILMPLRHTFNVQYLNIVLDRIDMYRKIDNPPKPMNRRAICFLFLLVIIFLFFVFITIYYKYYTIIICVSMFVFPAIYLLVEGIYFTPVSVIEVDNYERFWKATVRSYGMLKVPLVEPEPLDENISDEQINKILDTNSHKNLTENMQTFREPITHAYHTTINNIIKELGHKPEGLVISLSGGVDSMASSLILANKCQKLDIKLLAVMINYGNRTESLIEVEFVKRWCNLLGIDLYVYHIDFIKRTKNKKLRNFYEDVTRRIRFAMYARFGYPVFLGHNKNDTIENLFSNITKGIHYDNLFGMSEISYESGIMIVRALLNITKEGKEGIFDFADRHMVPYLYDSTPDWSERGRMRDILIPFLIKYNPAIINGLIKLAKANRCIYGVCNDEVFNRYKETITINDTEIYFPLTDKVRRYGYQFWKNLFLHCNLHQVRGKAITMLSERIEKRKNGTAHLMKGVTCKITNDAVVVITAKIKIN